MANPRYRVEMDIGLATASWVLGVSRLGVDAILRDGTTITAIPMSTVPNPVAIATSRGRQDEWGQIQPGTATVTMDNSDGRYSPDNPASPYYGSIRPRRRMRVSATMDGITWYPLYYGYVNSIRPVDASASTQVAFGAMDWLGRAQKTGVTATRPIETAAARIAAIVAALGDDTRPSAIDTDESSTVLAATLADGDGIQHIQSVCDITRGYFFQTAGGTLAYHSRFHRARYPGAFASAAVFGRDVTGSYPGFLVAPLGPGQLDYDFDDKYLYNEVKVHATATAEAEQVQADIASQTENGRVTYTLDSDLMPAGVAANLAAHILSGYRISYPRVHSLTVDLANIRAQDRPVLWPLLWGLEVGDTVRVLKDKPSSLGIDVQMFVEGVQHGIDMSDGFVSHTITLLLSDQRQAGIKPWILGRSQLGRDTYLSY